MTAFKPVSKPVQDTPKAVEPAVVSGPEDNKETGGDPESFRTYLNENAKPGLLSFLNNAFHLKLDGRQANFFFDRSHANLIPMIRNPMHLNHLADLGKAHFGFEVDFHFSVGNDPAIAAKRKREQDAMDTVRANTAIKFLLDTYGGKIMNCEILEDKKES